MSEPFEREFSAVREQPAPPAPPQLFEAARVAAGDLRASRRHRLRTRTLIGALGVVVLVGAAYTPPGRAATGWLGRLAGIGEEPSLPQVGSVPGKAVVLASGELSDGTPYEVVAKQITAESSGFADIPKAVCFQVDWPGLRPTGSGGGCLQVSQLSRTGGPPFDNPDAASPPDSPEPDAPMVFGGEIARADVADVRVLQIDRDGNQTELPSELLSVDAETLELGGGDHPVRAFFAVLDSPIVRAGNAREAQVRAVAYDAEGQRLGSTDAFPPLDCPRDPSSLTPAQPVIPEPPHPTTPEEADQMQRAIECGVHPVPPSRTVMEQASLDRSPVPAPLLETAASLGLPVQPATLEQLASVFHKDFAGVTAEDVMRRRPYELPNDSTGYAGDSHVYLAAKAGTGQLVYIAQLTVRAFFSEDGSRQRPEGGVPRTFVAIIDAVTGDVLVQREIDTN